MMSTNFLHVRFQSFISKVDAISVKKRSSVPHCIIIEDVWKHFPMLNDLKRIVS